MKCLNLNNQPKVSQYYNYVIIHYSLQQPTCTPSDITVNKENTALPPEYVNETISRLSLIADKI